MEPASNTVAPYEPMPDAEVDKLALAIVGGSVFGTWNIPQEEVQMVFMGVYFWDEAEEYVKANHITHFYEYSSEAGLHSVNGYPSFLSFRMLDAGDGARVLERIRAIQAAAGIPT